MTLGSNDLRGQIVKSYWGPVARFLKVDEAPLWERIEIYMLSLLLDDYSFEVGAPIWLTGDEGLRLLRARTAIKLEKALDRLVELLKLLKADQGDILWIMKCRDNIALQCLARDGEREGATLLNDEDPADLKEIVSECYKMVKLVECKYFSRNVERCMSRYFGREKM